MKKETRAASSSRVGQYTSAALVPRSPTISSDIMKTRANAMSPKSAGVSRRASAIIMTRVSSLAAPTLQQAQTTLRAAAREIEPMDELGSANRTLGYSDPAKREKGKARASYISVFAVR